jgi:MFS family permease
MRVLIAAQVLGGAGFFLGIAVAVLLARELSDTDALLGVPTAIAVAASAGAAGPIGAWMQRAGRRPGLVAGQLCGAVGAGVILLSGAIGSFGVFCLGMAAFGIGNTAGLLTRYAASDLAPVDRRGRAISTILLATAAGAILGPNLAETAGRLGDELGVPAEAAPFAISAVLLVASAATLFVLLRPDPLLRARDLDHGGPAPGEAAPELVEPPGEGEPGRGSRGVWTKGALTGAGAMVLANLTMISIMTMTPIHLDDADQSLATVGLVISLHVAGMFLPSPVTGVLVDRVGRLPVIAAAGVVLIAAGGLGIPSSGHETVLITASLVLLGIGWNLGLVGGSTLLTDSVPLERRAHAQGQADMAMGAAGALGSLLAGPALAVGGFALIAIAGTFLGAALVLVALRAGLFEPAPAVGT